MADLTSAAMLKDNKVQADSLITKIKNNFNKYDGLDKADQQRLVNIITNDLKNIDSLISVMKIDVKQLKDEHQEKMFSDQISILKQEYKKLNEEFLQKKNQKNALDNLILQEIQLEQKPIDQLNILEAKARGHDILDKGDIAIRNIENNADNMLNVGAQIKIDLRNQEEKLVGVQDNLKEIDYSLARARKQLATMFKMYATDKIIMCMIVIILLVIIAIIIVAAVGGDKNNSFNVPHDIWISNTTTTTTTPKTY